MESLNNKELLFVGNNWAEDLKLVETALTLLEGSPCQFTGLLIDTCSMWMAIGG